MFFFARAFPVAALVTMMHVSVASAALIVSGGTSTCGINPCSIPGGASNELLNSALFGNTGVATGTYGAQVSVGGTGSGFLHFDFLGFEAGFRNVFKYQGNTIFSTEGPVDIGGNNREIAASLATPLASFTTSAVSGLLDFSFWVNGILGVTNGTNPDDTKPGAGINFFVSHYDPNNPFSLILWLDDAGAGPDDNHDDMVIRITQTPLPMALPLFATGLGMMGLLAWRKKRRATKQPFVG